ncbi:hypothetical protein Kpol_1072p36 [Vanderwaltozyma polyspora DSM 70294]|uniref:Uncharacterized protein n=1 Tax=Vanderwaltozyma polyspora (strain ATCC 22028 / DSM 70294 / BCRC 21397 / CBS 2163 / NBRC 10782 / NRRL Y-8283 / UCD 57-17) TaxID=436907 RepID=A7TKQ4_VANPO|nr:uncharacterized protein Kpol_1072p36 [Vanderwaltozyma polyspora DSM 70294]EDO17166.1 hypothetical protein Kpol_1072p36 [Vanderwaltozyma polyspora DSM 70294]
MQSKIIISNIHNIDFEQFSNSIYDYLFKQNLPDASSSLEHFTNLPFFNRIIIIFDDNHYTQSIHSLIIAYLRSSPILQNLNVSISNNLHNQDRVPILSKIDTSPKLVFHNDIESPTLLQFQGPDGFSFHNYMEPKVIKTHFTKDNNEILLEKNTTLCPKITLSNF